MRTWATSCQFRLTPSPCAMRALQRPRESYPEGFEPATPTILEIQTRVRAGSVDARLFSRRLDVYDEESTEDYTETYQQKHRAREARDAGRWDLVVAELETWESPNEHDAKLLLVARRRLASRHAA